MKIKLCTINIHLKIFLFINDQITLLSLKILDIKIIPLSIQKIEDTLTFKD